MKKDKIVVPKSTLKRYPIYLKALRMLNENGVTRVLSSQLADMTDIQATTIRRDFSFIGSLGKQGYGYDVASVIETFNMLLGVSYQEDIIIVGVGNLGKALLNYNRWTQVVGKIVCGFDYDENKCGMINGVPVYHLSQLKEKIPPQCRVAIVCVSHDAQIVVDQLVECGVCGIIDFSNEHIKVNKDTILKQIDVVGAIQEIVFQANNI